MTLELRIFAVVIAVLASVLLMVVYRKDAVYIFVALWLFLPKLGTNLFGIAHIPLFSFVELACALTLFFIALKSGNRQAGTAVFSKRKLWAFTYEGAVVAFFSFMVFSQCCVFMWVPYVNPGLHTDIPGGVIFHSINREIAAAIFFYACYKLITTIEEIERILKLFIILSVLLASELLSVLWIPPIANIIKRYSLDKDGYFNSIFINDYQLLCLLAATGALASLHFFWKERKRRWLISFLMASLVIIFSLHRTTIVAFALAVGVFFYLAYFRLWPIWKRTLCAVIPIVAVLAVYNPNTLVNMSISLSDNLSSEVKSARIIDFVNTDSTMVRFGVQLRALEVIVHIFPLGVGSNMMLYYMGGDAPRIYYVTHPDLFDGYSRVAENVYSTETHNGYIEQIGSYGLLGALSLVLLVALFYRNLISAKVKDRPSLQIWPFAVSVTILLGVYYLFQGYPRVYIILFLALHMSFLIKKPYMTNIKRSTNGN